MYGIFYYFGLDVYDFFNCYDFIQVGMIFICEFVIYICEEGLGICLENDILVIDDGLVDFCVYIFVEVEVIEEYMNVSILSSI